MAKKKLTPEALCHDRWKCGLNQTDYWRRYGVIQSAGSRYEAGRKLPKPLYQLMSTKGAVVKDFNSKVISSKKLIGLRKKLGMNQKDFWGLVSVTQSGGCRYEAGRNMPKYLYILIRIVFKDLATNVGIKL